MIVVFDAQRLLCNGWVPFILRHDREAGRAQSLPHLRAFAGVPHATR
jgi:predicted DCC family thiol-disulfide oxidoreductase YuxK